MGKRGPKPAPNELKILSGTRAARIGPVVLAPGSALPVCPGWLDATATAKWAEMVPVYARLGVLAEADGELLALYCDTFSRLMRARADMEAFGTVSETDAGSPKTNPAAGVAEKATAQLVKILAELGGSPSSRGRLTIEPAAKPADPFAEFMAKKKV